ncbi:Glutathione peroxidase [Amphibalanus amphitrite]|uniref:Glutathione peroxidase n=1 Tax=Amphibalanus amphitrite TaxID=1232801 RepID=A0A6A4V3Q4_AMPAM|nr:Glutathione peroxidase [Amphibalanus amphitrite]
MKNQWVSNAHRLSIMASSKDAASIYDFTCRDIDGNEVPLSKYEGQLVQLYDTYSEQGLRILAFPCNQFDNQEPGTPNDIKKFVAGYGVKFDMFTKIKVNGSGTDPLWVYLKSKQRGTLGNFIKWNFAKFVVDRKGQPVARFGPGDDPIPAVEDAVKELL